MNNHLKALLATATSLGPLVLKQYVPAPWSYLTFLIYAVLVYIGYLKLIRPDERFILIRTPTLDAAFDETFSEQFPNPADGHQPFRVHVFQPKCFWFRKWLVPTYSYNSNSTHGDHGRCWPKGHGLCWSVYQSGVADFCRRNQPQWNNFGLTEAEKLATEHVWAVFAVPLRKPAKTDEEKVSSKITAILTFDALSEEAANVLEQHFALFSQSKNKKLLDRAAWVSLFF